MAKRKTFSGKFPSQDNPQASERVPNVQPNPTGIPCKPAEKPLGSGLYLVATPIGNASDITLRALDLLARADLVLCEDTRVSGKLLKIHGLHAPLQAYHEHNAERVRPMVMNRLQKGDVIALISDAGMPLISDPGYRLVEDCVKQGHKLTALPGASSSLTALVLSGLPTDRFFFQGFLPPKSTARKKVLAEIANIPGTLIFLESAKRLAASLADMNEVLGSRPAAVGRELTKFYEEIRRGPLDDLAAHYEQAGAPKGEITLCVSPPLAAEKPSEEELDQLLMEALNHFSVKQVAAQFALETGISKRTLYARAQKLKDEAS